MSQNIYDNPEFYAGYSQLPRSREGLAAAPEWQRLSALLPDLAGARILDLGCGFGAFDRWAIRQGAQKVLAVDLSEKMLAAARSLNDSPDIEYRQSDITALNFSESHFDLIYSALAFHYVQDFNSLCREMRSRLIPGGRLVASVEHPIFSAPNQDTWSEVAEGKSIWPLDNYLNEGPRVRTWFTDGVIKYHRTIESYITALLDNGFQLTALTEWGPDELQLAEHPEWRQERDRPMFLLFSAEATG